MYRPVLQESCQEYLQEDKLKELVQVGYSQLYLPVVLPSGLVYCQLNCPAWQLCGVAWLASLLATCFAPLAHHQPLPHTSYRSLFCLQRYSEFINFPIFMLTSRTEEKEVI